MSAERPSDRLDWAETRRLIACDVDVFAAWPRAFGAWPRSRPPWLGFLSLLVTQHMFAAVMLYRLQSYIFDRGLGWAATVLARVNHTLFGVTIGHHVRTTGGLYIAHGHVVIDGLVRLGHSVQIAPFVTIGLVNSDRDPFTLVGPTIGDHVNIGTGAKVLGPVHIGDHAKIGANAVVVDDVPAWHTAAGVPAVARPRASAPAQDDGDEGVPEAAG